MMRTRSIVSIEATPAPLDIDLAKTAALVIDMQNDFGSKRGMFDRAGIDVSVIQRAVGPTAQVIASARAVGVPIIYVTEEHRPDLSDIGCVGSPYWRMCQRLARLERKSWPQTEGRAASMAPRNEGVPELRRMQRVNNIRSKRRPRAC